MNRDIIKSKVASILENTPNLELPVNIKHVTKFYKHCKCRLIPFSHYMKTNQINYEEMLSFANTKDAFCNYIASEKQAIIFYNDVDKSLISSNRYRWNIAHELGHIALGHLTRGNSSRLFRTTLTDIQDPEAEIEADQFASYILVPYIVLRQLKIQSAEELMKICKISKQAAQIRYEQYLKWDDFPCQYDYRVLAQYYNILKTKYGCDCRDYIDRCNRTETREPLFAIITIRGNYDKYTY